MWSRPFFDVETQGRASLPRNANLFIKKLSKNVCILKKVYFCSGVGNHFRLTILRIRRRRWLIPCVSALRVFIEQP